MTELQKLTINKISSTLHLINKNFLVFNKLFTNK